jgi:preprotein translocase subunit SecG
MITVLLVVHLLVTLALIGVVLIQRSEGGGLGVGTSQGMGSFMSGRGTANLLTRTTAILAAAFFVLSLALALLNRGTTLRASNSILDNPPPARTAPAIEPHQGPAAPADTTPAPATAAQAPAPTPESQAAPAPGIPPVPPASTSQPSDNSPEPSKPAGQ